MITSPDSLKTNLSTYLNQYRLSNDSYDILDAQVVNFGISFTIMAAPGQNKNTIKQNVLARLAEYFSIKNFEIDQPIIINDIENIIYNSPGVLSLIDLRFDNIKGSLTSPNANIREYSTSNYDLNSNTDKKIIFPPAGGIFELRYKDFDLEGQVL